jgi:hypothetical protein
MRIREIYREREIKEPSFGVSRGRRSGAPTAVLHDEPTALPSARSTARRSILARKSPIPAKSHRHHSSRAPTATWISTNHLVHIGEEEMRTNSPTMVRELADELRRRMAAQGNEGQARRDSSSFMASFFPFPLPAPSMEKTRRVVVRNGG